jgi:predicted Zn-dependent peptidase
LIAPLFGSVLPGDDFSERITPPGRFSVDLNYRHLEQVHLCMTTTGLPITAPERYTASLINTIFGGNMSSRLFQEIREKQGLAYAVYSFMSSHIDTGMFGIYAGVAPQKVQQAVVLILKEIRKLKNEPVGDTELQAAKDFTRGNILLAAESVDNQMVRLAQNEIHFGRNIPIEEIMAGIDSVSRQDILELASRLFDTERLALTLLGPLENPEPFEAIMGSRT